MFDVFLQKESGLDCPACGGVFSLKKHPDRRDELLLHYGETEIKDSSPPSREVAGAFGLLAEDASSFFSLCSDPEKLDRNRLERYLQEDLEKLSRKDPLVHMKEIAARPILDLKEDEIKQPTSRVKKFAARALEYLACHSEDWRNRSFVGVHPQRLLSLVRDDKWETYENRLLYTLCKTLNSLIDLRLRELQSIDDAYGEIQKYYEIAERVDYESMGKFVNNALIDNYSSDQVNESRELLARTIDFLKRLRRTIRSFWNTPLFGYLRQIPNVEVDINQFVMTNILMNNQHYLYLPKIQKVVVSCNSQERSTQERLAEQRALLGNEIKYVERCIDDFRELHQHLWGMLKIEIVSNEMGIVLKCESRTLRFSFASSEPAGFYRDELEKAHGDENVVSVLVYPREKPYLEADEDGFSMLMSEAMFGKRPPKGGSYSSLGISPQSVFSKFLIQRLLLQWAWPLLMSHYPFELPQNKFIEELVSDVSDGHLFKKADVREFERSVDAKEHENRIGKKELDAFRKKKEYEKSILQEANTWIEAAYECPCCGDEGVLSPGGTAKNYEFRCKQELCGNRWARNGNKVRWIKNDENKLFGMFENFDVLLKSADTAMQEDAASAKNKRGRK